MGASSVATGDLNNDGHLDVISISETDSRIAAYESDGNRLNTIDGNSTFTEGGAPVTLDMDVQIFDAELSALNNGIGDFGGATLTIERSGGANSDDVFSAAGPLSFSATDFSLSGVKKGTFTSVVAGQIVLTFDPGVTNDEVNQVMQSLQYSNSSDAPPASVGLEWTFSDNNSGSQGAGPAFQTVGVTTVNITPVNDAPDLAAGANPRLENISEDDIGNGGERIEDLLAKIGNPITDADANADEGIAVTVNNGNGGTWQYSIDDGTTWEDVGTVSIASTLLLRDSDLLRLNPDEENRTNANLGFRAWDQTSGHSAGARINIPANGGTGGTSAFSTNQLSAQIQVTNLNDAPELNNSGTITLTDINEDDTNPIGDLVSAIIASGGIDRITDVDDNNPLEGIAVTSVDNTNGTWQYRESASGPWSDIPLLVAGDALLLDPADSLRFVANADYDGTSGDITYRAWDQTGSGNAGSVVTISATGGTTPFSTTTETASLNVVAINDAPTLTTIEAMPAFYTEGGSPVYSILLIKMVSPATMIQPMVY